MSFTFVHAADLHLDTPVSGVGRTSRQIVDALRDASVNAWQRLVQLTLDREAAFLIVAGDICDGVDVGLRAHHRFRQGLQTLSDRGVIVFLAFGDRDRPEEWPSDGSLPDNVIVFGTDRVESHPVERGGRRVATVHGISHSAATVGENLARRFHGGGEGLRIGVLHCGLEDSREPACSDCSPGDLAAAGMHYWALGHDHRHQVIDEDGVQIVYPGTLQGRAISVAEHGRKGAVVVDVADDGQLSIEHVPVDAVRFAMWSTSIDGIRDLTGLRDSLAARADELRASHDGRDVIVRARLMGAGPLVSTLVRSDAAQALLRELRDHGDLERPVVWWDRIDVHTTIADADVLHRRGDFASEVLQRAQEVGADPARLPPTREADAEAFARLDLQRFQLDPVDADEQPAIVRDAARLAVGALEE